MIEDDIWEEETLELLSKKNGIQLTTISNGNSPSVELAETITKVFLSYGANLKKRIRELEKMYLRYKEDDTFNVLLYTSYIEDDNIEKAEEILMEMFNRNPKNLLVISAKIIQGRSEEEMIKYGTLLGEPRDAKTFFGTDKIFAGDFYDFQAAALAYEIFLEEFASAIQRLEDLRLLGMPFLEFADWAESIAFSTAVDTLEKLKEKDISTEREFLFEIANNLIITSDENMQEEDDLDETSQIVFKLQMQVIDAMMNNVKQEDFEFNYDDIIDDDLFYDDFDEYDELDEYDEFISILEGEEESQEHQATIVNLNPKVGRNDPCPCGSGKKHKKCCLNK